MWKDLNPQNGLDSSKTQNGFSRRLGQSKVQNRIFADFPSIFLLWPNRPADLFFLRWSFRQVRKLWKCFPGVAQTFRKSMWKELSLRNGLEASKTKNRSPRRLGQSKAQNRIFCGFHPKITEKLHRSRSVYRPRNPSGDLPEHLEGSDVNRIWES